MNWLFVCLSAIHKLCLLLLQQQQLGGCVASAAAGQAWHTVYELPGSLNWLLICLPAAAAG
jgi:hypothetical protein